MKSKWKATVSNPLGQESYDMTLEDINNTIQVQVINEKGSATFTKVVSKERLIFSTSVDTPMRANVNLEFLTEDYSKEEKFDAILTIGEFSTMLVECVKYE
jgi:hypothetical protein